MKKTAHIPSYNINASGELLRDGNLVQVPGFRLVKVLGTGANGSVFLAKEKNLDRDVAIKFWNGAVTDKQHRALDEISKLAQIRHPNFVHVYRFDVSEGNVAYAVMEYVEGQSLKNWLKTAQEPLERLAIWTQYSSAMAHLYCSNVFHGDPHAGNVMLQPATPDYKAPILKGSYVPYPDKYKVLILDTGTSRFWRSKANFEEREKRILFEVIDLLFGGLTLQKPVKVDRSLSMKQILSLGDSLAVLFARNAIGFPNGSENLESAEEELAYVEANTPTFVKSHLRSSFLLAGETIANRRRLYW